MSMNLPSKKIQPKLEVNPPNDKYEKEADNVADRISRMPSNASENLQMSSKEDEENKIQMQPTEEEETISMKPEDEEDKIQMSPSSSEGQNVPQVSSGLTSRLNSTKGKGNPLSDGVSKEMGKNIGSDFNNVRVHTDSNAIQMSKELGAKAFTHGNDIYFNSGKYNPESSSGKHLLAHELTHTLQQSQGIQLSFLESIFGKSNEDIAEEIKDQNGGNNIEALAQLFENNEIDDDNTVSGRLATILEITEHNVIPGLQTGGPFDTSDVGFKQEYKDPWESSRNQVGHFLTAVGFAFDPAVVNRSFMGSPLRDWLDAPSTMSDEDVAIRLMIGHEKSPDPSFFGAVGECILESSQSAYYDEVPGMSCMGQAPWIMLENFKKQFNSATDEDVERFKALRAIILKKNITPEDFVLIEDFVDSVGINSGYQGCSEQDLRLSIIGWVLGELIKNNEFNNRAEVASWLRQYIAE